MFLLPRKNVVPRKQDRLILELGKFEDRLQKWIGRSERNARWFQRDPLAAMRAAGLQIDDELMCELELLMGDLARKIQK